MTCFNLIGFTSNMFPVDGKALVKACGDIAFKSNL